MKFAVDEPHPPIDACIQTRDGNNITIRDLRTEYLNPLAPKADQL
jgi:hypothetical protein